MTKSFSSLYLVIIITISASTTTFAQWPVLQSGKVLNPSDPSEPYSLGSFNGERFNMVGGEIYSWGFTGAYAFGQNRHQFLVDIPFVRSSVAGIEDLVGIGDITMRYKGVVHEMPEGLKSYKTTTFYFDLSICTISILLVESRYSIAASRISSLFSTIPCMVRLTGISG